VFNSFTDSTRPLWDSWNKGILLVIRKRSFFFFFFFLLFLFPLYVFVIYGVSSINKVFYRVASVCQGLPSKSPLEILIQKGQRIYIYSFLRFCFQILVIPSGYPLDDTHHVRTGNFFKTLAGFRKMKNLHSASKGIHYIFLKTLSTF
jgi:hypothetical protein